jgi:transcription elongation factor Elf1
MTEQRSNQDEPSESKEYRKLVSDLKGIIDDARAKGIDLTQRMDTLTCSICGAYEELTTRGHRLVVEPQRQYASMNQFLIIDCSQKTFQRKQVRYFRTTYTFICSACGAYQNTIVKDQFPS